MTATPRPDLVEGLRELEHTQVLNHTAAAWIEEAAAEITRLRAQPEALAEALRPFAAIEFTRTDENYGWLSEDIDIANIKRARELLKKGGRT